MSPPPPPVSPIPDVPADVAYLRSVLPSTTDDAFFDYLATLDASEVTVTAIPEGSVVFARVGPPFPGTWTPPPSSFPALPPLPAPKSPFFLTRGILWNPSPAFSSSQTSPFP